MAAIGMRRVFALLFSLGIVCTWLGYGRAQERNKYVGSETCKACHAEEYESFLKHSKKVGSYQSIALMKKELSGSELQGCYKCHTTGYGEPGGFRSEQETPQLKNAGCETCHGPGGTHSETGDKDDIKGKLTMADCDRCHSADRVAAFRYKPLIYGGAH
ncbi:conserved exported hypothetical protein [Syntrophobacter sp. SbD1]|nr:conserved exported hypothetical protein [Syntrophobacter sp. SbD1]